MLCVLHAMKAFLKLINLLVLLLVLPFRGRWRVAKKQLKDEKGGRVKVATGLKTVSASPHACDTVGTVDQEVAARRALAVKMVVEDKDDGKSLREFLFFVGVKGRTLLLSVGLP